MVADGEPRGSNAWQEHTTAFDRVRSIALGLREPRMAGWIAEEAHVAPNTARDHLERLVELSVLQATDADGRTEYYPDPLYTRLQALRELLRNHDRDELLELRAELQERIEEFRADYDVETPGELRTLAATAETAEETRSLRQAANDWELIAYRQSLVADAIENYGDYESSPVSPADV